MEDRDIYGQELCDENGISSGTQATQSGEKLKCDKCDYFTSNKYYLKQHVGLVHSPERPFRCPFCDYAGKRSHSLKEHLIVHSNERPYECNQCNATFRKKGHLTNHTKMHSNPVSSYSECRLCRTTFDQRSDLYSHLRTIHCLSSFQCSFCEYATTIKSNLIMHENGHADKSKIKIMAMKPKIPPGALVILKCTACGFETSDKHVFELHMVDHSGMLAPNHSNASADSYFPTHTMNKENKLHLPGATGSKCTECDFTTVDAYTFITHILSHKPSAPDSVVGGQPSSSSRSLFTQDACNSTFCCNICGYVCDSQRTIKAHVWKHSGHQQLEYPTFQNGSPSIYDGTPLGRDSVTSLLSEARLVRSEPLHLPGSTSPVTPASSQSANKTSVGDCLRPLGKVEEAELSVAGRPEGAEYTKAQSSIVSDVARCVSSKLRDPELLPAPQQCLTSERPAKVEMADCTSQAPSVVSCTDSLTAHSLRSAAVAERQDSAITLLSLLKKGPNVNPACPPTNSSSLSAASLRLLEAPPPKRQKLADHQKKDCTVSIKPGKQAGIGSDQSRRGICSSLLAVIEQLRESSDTEEVGSSSNGSLGDGSFSSSSAPQAPLRSSRVAPGGAAALGAVDAEPAATEALDCLSNVERTIGGGHRCRLCHYSASPGASGAALLVQHMKTHKSRQPFGCTLCDHVATSSEALQVHVISHCKMRTYQCKLCPTSFNYKSQLRAHARMHAADGPGERQHLALAVTAGGGKSTAAGNTEGGCCTFACPCCSHSASSVGLLRCHLRMVHGYFEEAGGTFHCTACAFAFASLEDVSTHTCPASVAAPDGTVRLAAGNGRAVEESHGSGRQPAVSFCAADEGATAHVHGSCCATMKCEQCDFVALSARSLKSHLKRHLNDRRYVEQPLEQYKCNMCGYVCHHLPSLKSHMWRHASDKKYSYQSANAAINAAIDHDAGIRGTAIPAAQREFVSPCDGSNEAEDSKITLVAFRCCQCGFETVDKATLNTHMKEHSDIIRKTLSICVDVHS